MQNFDDIEAIKKLDPQNVLGSTEKIVEQMQTAWSQVSSLNLPKIENVKSIVFCGMGGSIFGALVTQSLLARELPYPTTIITDYLIPPWADENTLVVLTSYSGSTEEVLSCADEALAKNCKMLVVASGGPLAEFARNNNISAYIFDDLLNPAGQPRMGLGYTILGLLGLLNNVKVVTIEEHEITNALIRLNEKFTDFKTMAKFDSELFIGKIPVILAAEHLSGNAHIIRNQFNETCKTFSTFFLIPDLNHHLMEGLQFPKNAPLHFIALKSLIYSEKIQKRMDLTIDVIKQNNIPVYSFETSGQTIYDDSFEVLTYSSLLVFYLAMRYDLNPVVIPWVDYFKKKLNE